MRRILMWASLYTWALPVTLFGWVVALLAKPTGHRYWKGPVCFVEVKSPRVAMSAWGGVVHVRADSNILPIIEDVGEKGLPVLLRLRLEHAYWECVQIALLGVLHSPGWLLAALYAYIKYGGEEAPDRHLLENNAMNHAADVVVGEERCELN